MSSTKNDMDQTRVSTKTAVVGAIIVFALALVAWAVIRSVKSEDEGKNAKKKPVPLVEVVAADKKEISETIELPGEVMANNRVTVKTTVTGFISHFPWREGDTAEAGEVLVRISRPRLVAEMEAQKAAVEVAKAKLADIKAGARPEEILRAQYEVNRLRECEGYTQSDLERNEKLFKKNVVSKENVEMAKVAHTKCGSDLQAALEALKMLKEGATRTQIAVLEAQVTEANAKYKILLEKVRECEIKAPFSGIITNVYVREGDLVREGRDDVVLLEMLDPDSLVARTAVPESQSTRITIGMPAVVRFDAYPGRTFDAKISRVYPELDFRTRTRTVEASLNSPPDLMPRMFVRIKIALRVETDATVIPASAVLTTVDGRERVFVVSDGEAAIREVRLGIERNHEVQVVDGVVPGEKVVVRGNEKLKNGAKVRLPRAGKRARPPAKGNEEADS